MAGSRNSGAGSPPDDMTAPRRLPAHQSAPPDLVIRAAGAGDLDQIVALRLQLLREEARSPLYAHPRRDVAEQARILTEAHLASTTEVTFLALDGDEAVGLLRCTVSRAGRLVHPTRYGFLTSAFVRPSHRRRGVLRSLVERAESWCDVRGLREIRLHCTVENAEGNATWESLGYTLAEIVRHRTIGSR